MSLQGETRMTWCCEPRIQPHSGLLGPFFPSPSIPFSSCPSLPPPPLPQRLCPAPSSHLAFFFHIHPLSSHFSTSVSLLLPLKEEIKGRCQTQWQHLYTSGPLGKDREAWTQTRRTFCQASMGPSVVVIMSCFR